MEGIPIRVCSLDVYIDYRHGIVTDFTINESSEF